MFGVRDAPKSRDSELPIPPQIVSRFVEGNLGVLSVERGVAQAALL